MPGKDIFLYFLTDSANNCYRQLPDGSVELSAQPAFIKNKPLGWKEVELSFNTVSKYFSNVKALAVPLQYVFDGAEILRYLLYKGRGFEAEVYCLIMRLDSATGDHHLEYRGRLDMSKAVDNPAKGVTVSAKEGGFQSDLDANESVSYELPLTFANGAKKVLYDGILLFDTFNYNTYELEIDVLTAHYNDTTLHSIEKPYVFVPLVFLNNEGDNVGISSGNQTFDAFNNPSFLADSSNTPFQNFGKEVSIHIKGDYIFSLSTAYAFSVSPSLFKAFIYVVDPAGTTVYEVASYNVVYGNSYTVNINMYVTVTTNGKIFLVFRFPTEVSYLAVPSYGIDTKYKVKFYADQVFKISFTSINTPSSAYALTPLDVANQLVKQWNPAYQVTSTFLPLHNNILATSGQALRNLPAPVLVYTFQDWFNDYNRLYCLCINIIGNVMYIEQRKTHFASDTANVIFNLGTVSSYKLQPQEEYIFNTLRLGWTDQTYDQRNGKYEFNSEVELKAPVAAKKAELNLIGKARGDCYGMEFIRGGLNNKSSTDNAGDIQVFLVNTVARPQLYGSFTIQWAAITKTLTLTGQASARSLFAIGTTFESYNTAVTDFNDFLFTVVSATINGADLDIVVTQAAPATTAFFTGSVIFPYLLKRKVYTDSAGMPLISIPGIPTPNVDGPGAVYNVEEMRPADQFKAWESYLHSVLFQLTSDNITFQTAKKNKDLVTTINGVTTAEKSDYMVAGLEAPFFLNYRASFTCIVPFTFSKTLSALNTAGVVRLIYNGFALNHLPIGKMSSKPASGTAQEWELLLSADNDLNTLLQLSQPGLYISDGMDNTLTLSVFNPVHFIYNDKVLNPRYKYKDIWDDWEHFRYDPYAAHPAYLQKWELQDIVKVQGITVGISQLQLLIFRLNGKKWTEIDAKFFTLISEPAVRYPNILQQVEFQPSDYGEGIYAYQIVANDKILALSSIQHFAAVHPGTYIHDYYHSYNRLGAYWAAFRPMLRLEAMWDTERGQGSSADYQDETRLLTLDFDTYTSKTITYGSPFGIPEWLQIKLNNILFLDNTSIEGTQVTRPADSKFEVNEPAGYPLHTYSIELRRTANTQGISVTDQGVQTTAAVVYTVDAESFGRAPGIIEIQPE